MNNDAMQNSSQAGQNRYDPARLLDTMIDKLHLKNDAALSRVLDVQPPLISKIRNRKLPVGASVLIRMHEVSGLSIQELREIMGDRRNKFRTSNVYGRPIPMGAGPGSMNQNQPSM